MILQFLILEALFIALLAINFKGKSNSYLELEINFCFNLLSLAFISLVFSYFLALKFFYFWPLIILFGCYLAYQQKHLKSFYLKSLLASLSAAIALCVPTSYGDTGVYHLQAIIWYKDYGLVNGLAFLTEPLGNVSSWLALGASFSFLDANQGAILLGGLSLSLLFFIILNRLDNNNSKNIYFSALIILLISIQLNFYVAPAPDFIFLVISLVLLDAYSKNDFSNKSIILAGLLISVKLIAIFLFIAFIIKAFFKKAYKAILLNLFILLFTGFLGFKLSNCYFFPFYKFCAAEKYLEFAKYNYLHIGIHAKTCATGNLNDYWFFNYMLCNPLGALLFLLSFIGFFANLKENKGINFICLIIATYFLIYAPSLRYCASFLAYNISNLFSKYLNIKKWHLVLILLVLALAIFSEKTTQNNLYLALKTHSTKALVNQFVEPFQKIQSKLRYGELPKMNKDNLSFFIRDEQSFNSFGDFCWDSQIPCTWEKRLFKLQLKSKNIDGGFDLK